MLSKVLLCLLLGLTSHAFAVTFEVSSSEEFQAALSAAASNGGDDVIILKAGSYPGNFKYIAQEAFNLQVVSETGVGRDAVILDGELRAYVFRLDARAFNFDVVIKNLTVTGGKSEEPGGGLSLKGSRKERLGGGRLLLDSVLVKGNYARESAGLEATGWAHIQIKGSEFVDNGKYLNPTLSLNMPGGEGAAHANLSGGSIDFTDNLVAQIADNLGTNVVGDVPWSSAISFQTQQSSGAAPTDPEFSLCVADGAPLLSVLNSRFVNFGSVLGVSGDPGGAGGFEGGNVELLLVSTAIVADANCIIINNNTIREVSALRTLSINGSQVDFIGNQLLNNHAGYSSIFSSNDPVNNPAGSGLVFSANIFRNHSALGQSYGNIEPVIQFNGPLEMRGNIVTDVAGGVRIGSQNGGGLYNGEALVMDNLIANVKEGCSLFTHSANVSLLNNTVYRTKGSGICLEASGDAVLNLSNNIVWPAAGLTEGLDIQRIGYGLSSTLTHNIFQTASELWDVDQNNAKLDPQFFDVENNDFHVLAESPAINGGLNTGVTSVLDLDGSPRILDGAVDIGAYERSTTALHPADSNGDSAISAAEFEAYNTAWRANDTWATAPSQIPVDYVTRAGYLLQKGGAYKNIGVGKPATWVPVN
jgi:hypothetical protein